VGGELSQVTHLLVDVDSPNNGTPDKP